jgi:hypothetical protein
MKVPLINSFIYQNYLIDNIGTWCYHNLLALKEEIIHIFWKYFYNWAFIIGLLL